MLRSLIERPSREALLGVLENEMIPSIARASEATEALARRPISADGPVAEVRALVDAWRDAPLITLAAHAHFLIWLWMDMDADFRVAMLGDLLDWWKTARDLARARSESREADWPASCLHPSQARYDLRCCSVEDLYGLMLQLYVIHSS